MLDLTAALAGLVEVIPRVCEELSHIDPARLLVGLTRARKRSRDGLLAKLVPLVEPGEFAWGGPLYAVVFCWPRFMSLPYERKLQVVFHELYHISPAFDGDFRRFPGRRGLHGGGSYEAVCAGLVAKALPALEATGRTEFLKLGVREARARFGGICGRFVRLASSGAGVLCARVKGPEPL